MLNRPESPDDAPRGSSTGAQSLHSPYDSPPCAFTAPPAARPAEAWEDPYRGSHGSAVAYALPRATTRIDGQAVVTAVNAALVDAYVHLNNYGSDDSYVRIGGERHTFSIPPKVKRICRLGGLACVGEARFYVNDVNLWNAAARWAGGVEIDLSLEGDGREIIGEGSNGLVGPFVPDAELKDVLGDDRLSARLRVRLVLVANNAGGVTYALAGAPSFTTRLELVNGCSDVFGVNLCPEIENAATRLRAKVETRVRTLLESPEARAEIDALLQERLASYGVTHPVDAVVTDSSGFLLLDF